MVAAGKSAALPVVVDASVDLDYGLYGAMRPRGCCEQRWTDGRHAARLSTSGRSTLMSRPSFGAGEWCLPGRIASARPRRRTTTAGRGVDVPVKNTGSKVTASVDLNLATDSVRQDLWCRTGKRLTARGRS